MQFFEVYAVPFLRRRISKMFSTFIPSPHLLRKNKTWSDFENFLIKEYSNEYLFTIDIENSEKLICWFLTFRASNSIIFKLYESINVSCIERLKSRNNSFLTNGNKNFWLNMFKKINTIQRLTAYLNIINPSLKAQ